VSWEKKLELWVKSLYFLIEFLRNKFFVFCVENDLDKAQDRLEVTEKKYKEKSRLFEDAKTEAVVLKRQIEAKESRIKYIKDQYNHQSNTLLTSSSRHKKSCII